MPPVASRTSARAALAGNPSDGFGGAVVAVEVAARAASAAAFERPTAMADDLARLVDATVQMGQRHLGVAAPAGWTVESSIPREVGLSGSSAIVISVLRELDRLAGSVLTPDELAVLALRVETEELGWRAGLQDRLVQAHGGLIAMDFSAEASRPTRFGPCGGVRHLQSSLVDDAVVVWRTSTAESSHASHGRVDPSADEVRVAMARSADAARRCATALENGDRRTVGEMMTLTWNSRISVYDVRADQRRLVDDYRSIPGVAVNQAGSGGAVIVFPVDGEPSVRRDEVLEAAARFGDGAVVVGGLGPTA